ncbi:uncharacterized zinc finger protein CG12744 [Drosophila eugracilis]|uniref:uncharacterized zinc finger protein CG12744 n=1 Tax=Drosophila eugracilis TaxID=29029 RepID=UPI0007E73B0E|nr:uncharacterized zinc finger protein CG12744 [Drosophila eugracilis]XP_017066646.1 uncharacterized zinc finger protein CG12744 [Drosophila eugracilis]XP_017066647.1 uncharacterized zinc finger protein CG12744 [Drosophila eugracilis]XP_017066648.1 uncharacterized zinc finger protein CG12744 [Drosophila eugracilis]
MDTELSETNLSCLLCENTFDTSEKLEEHLSIHFPDPVAKRKICDLCGRGVRSSLELHQHYKRFHEAHVPNTDGHYPCQFCDKIFLLDDHLSVHVKIEHSDDGYHPNDRSSEWQQHTPNSFDLPTDNKLDSILRPPPKRKYPPRSPFFNPNLWLDAESFM